MLEQLNLEQLDNDKRQEVKKAIETSWQDIESDRGEEAIFRMESLIASLPEVMREDLRKLLDNMKDVKRQRESKKKFAVTNDLDDSPVGGVFKESEEGIDEKIANFLAPQRKAMEAIAEMLKSKNNNAKIFDENGVQISSGQGSAAILQLQQPKELYSMINKVYEALAKAGLDVVKRDGTGEEGSARAFAVIFPKGYCGSRNILTMNKDDISQARQLRFKEQVRFQRESEERFEQEEKINTRLAELQKAPEEGQDIEEEMARIEAEKLVYETRSREILEERREDLESRITVNVVGSANLQDMSQFFKQTKSDIIGRVVGESFLSSRQPSVKFLENCNFASINSRPGSSCFPSRAEQITPNVFPIQVR